MKTKEKILTYRNKVIKEDLLQRFIENEEVLQPYDGVSGIYCLKMDGEIVYVGQATNIALRWISHVSNVYCKDSTRYHKAMYVAIRKAKLFNHSFSFEVLEYCEEEALNANEYKWMKYYCDNLKLNSRKPDSLGSVTFGEVETLLSREEREAYEKMVS